MIFFYICLFLIVKETIVGTTEVKQHLNADKSHNRRNKVDQSSHSLNKTGSQLQHKNPQKRSLLNDDYIDPMKYLELYLVNDYSIYKYHKRNISYIDNRSKHIVKLLNQRFRKLRLKIILVGVETWTKKDLIPMSKYSRETLLSFMIYREKHINSHTRNDNAQLITNRLFDKRGKTAGKAGIGTICSNRYSAGLNRDSHDNPIYIVNVLAHEIGHNLGIKHDDESENDDCKCGNQAHCIMEPRLDGEMKEFSTCSQYYFHEFLAEGGGKCLFDYPLEMRDIQAEHCGNGIIETDEECDCGDVSECKKQSDQCCDPYTCKLFMNATCSNGLCCQKCKLKVKGNVCRVKNGECDLPEYCDGKTENCPDDIHVKYSTSCADKMGYCINGTCMLHEQQCTEVLGNNTVTADPFCYMHLNMQGNKSGHCGMVNSYYQPCTKENSLCGKLQCVTSHQNESIRNTKKNMLRWLDGDNQFKECSNTEETMNDTGLVKEGTKCGDNKICLRNVCVPIEQYRGESYAKCNSSICSGHGVCNSKYNCHCNTGWSPPFCETPGNGGSINSGPPRDLEKIYFNPLFTIIGLFIVVYVVLTAIYCVRCIQKKNSNYRAKKNKSASIIGEHAILMQNLE